MNVTNIDIVINIDDNYLKQAVTMLTSVFANNLKLHVTVHVLSSGLSDSVQEVLGEWVRARYHQNIIFYSISKHDSDVFPKYVNSYISDAANYRLFVADILPADVHKVLYLDCDIVVDCPIEELVGIDISDCPVAAVEDMWSGKDGVYERLGYSRQYGYFNSGVLMINLDWWREHKLSEAFTGFLNNHPNLPFVDQDILNGVLHREWHSLPLRWNVQDGFLRRRPKIRSQRREELLKEMHSPAIIHFTGSRKPWNYDCQNPYRERYFHYLDMTPWMGERPVMSASFKRKLTFDKVLYALWLKPRKYRKGI